MKKEDGEPGPRKNEHDEGERAKERRRRKNTGGTACVSSGGVS